MTAPPSLPEFFECLSGLAREHASRFSSASGYDNKSGDGFDPVTQLDRDIESAMRALILDHFPDHGVWGEEEGWTNPGSRRHFSLDPVDGTRALICGLPSWCVLVGLLDNGDHVAGMIDCPALGERLVAVEGRTTREGMSVATSGCMSLVSARLATTDPYLFDGDEGRAFADVRGAAMLTRYGLDALAYARVATGDIDLVIENKLKRHDLDALVPVVRGAGGHIGDWSGGEDWNDGRIVAAATRSLYEEAVAILSR